MPDALTLTVEEVLQLQREHQRMKRALELIVTRASESEADLPDARTVPRVLAEGMLKTLAGFAQLGLEP